MTTATLPALLADLQDRNADDNGRWIAAFGADAGSLVLVLNDDMRRLALERFSSQEEGPLRIVIFQPGDSPYEYIFVPHQPTGAVAELLRGWGIAPRDIKRRLPYRLLHAAALESVFSLPAGPRPRSKRRL